MVLLASFLCPVVRVHSVELWVISEYSNRETEENHGAPKFTHSPDRDLTQKLESTKHLHDNLPVKEKVKFALEQAMKGQRGSRGIALLFL